MGSPILTDKKLGEVLSDKEMLDRMVKLISPRSSFVVLDLGTGKGNTAIALAPYVKKITAIDHDDAVIEKCKINIREKGVDHIITVQKSDVNKLDFPDKSFDLVTCRAAFHHFPNSPSVLAEVMRVLKDEGQFYLMDPIFSDHAKQVWTPIAKVRETDLNGFLTYLETIELLNSAGFNVVKYRPFYFRRVLDEWINDAPEEIRKRLKEVVLSLDPIILKELHLQTEDNSLVYYYNVFELIAMKSFFKSKEA